MERELDALLRRIERIEALLIGSDDVHDNKVPLLDNLLKFNGDMVAATNGRERIQNVFRKVDEIDQFLDPHWLDSGNTRSQTEKMEVILAEERSMRQMINDLEELERLKPVLESKAIEETPHLLPKLNAVRADQHRLSGEADKLIGETRDLLTEQTLLMNNLNRLFVNWDETITTMELAKIQRNLPKEE